MRKIVYLVIIFSTLLLNLHKASSQSVPGAPFKEYEIKAAFIYNFIKFIEWPEDIMQSSEDITIAILGKDPFGEHLDKLIDGKSIKDKRLTIERYTNVQEIDFCHVLFISKSETKYLRPIFAYLGLKNKSYLTVGESPEFLELGGIIRLLNQSNKVRFEINLKQAHQSKLKISSRLLRLADNLRDAVAFLVTPQPEFFEEKFINDLLNQFEAL